MPARLVEKYMNDGIEKALSEFWKKEQPTTRIAYTDSETAKWALVKDELGDNVVRECAICDDCLIGASIIDGHKTILTFGMSGAYEVEERFNYCPVCGRKL